MSIRLAKKKKKHLTSSSAYAFTIDNKALFFITYIIDMNNLV